MLFGEIPGNPDQQHPYQLELVRLFISSILVFVPQNVPVGGGVRAGAASSLPRIGGGGAAACRLCRCVLAGLFADVLYLRQIEKYAGIGSCLPEQVRYMHIAKNGGVNPLAAGVALAAYLFLIWYGSGMV